MQHGDLLNSSEWQAVLYKGFGSKALYGWDEKSSTGVTITVFKAGPFRVGYLGFPVGGTVGNKAINPDMVVALKEASFPETIHSIKMPVSAFADHVELPLPSNETLETAHDNLQEWKIETMSHNLQKVVKKAIRSPLKIVDASDPSQGGRLFRLYRDTILRQKGNMRYTEKYFCALIELAKVHSNLRCFLAMMDCDIAGFLVVACHQGTAYDLHCCVAPEFKKHSPSDLLTYDAMTWAKGEGMDCYNLMSSPEDQMSLVSYKEKWGGVTRRHKTYELALRPVRAELFKAISIIYQRASLLLR
ncbi:MAG: GNAT family N-acetyltransferase [Desulfobacteraceae bacterium]|nr:GNAT family N-acetyltransferase [Desulfobacteraceae bacterium]